MRRNQVLSVKSEQISLFYISSVYSLNQAGNLPHIEVQYRPIRNLIRPGSSAG